MRFGIRLRSQTHAKAELGPQRGRRKNPDVSSTGMSGSETGTCDCDEGGSLKLQEAIFARSGAGKHVLITGFVDYRP